MKNKIKRTEFLSPRISCRECNDPLSEIHKGNNIVGFVCIKCKISWKIVDDDKYIHSLQFEELKEAHKSIEELHKNYKNKRKKK